VIFLARGKRTNDGFPESFGFVFNSQKINNCMDAIHKDSRATSAVQFLLFVILLTVVFYFGRPLIIPIVSAAFFAMLMAPVCRFLERKIKRPFAVIICILILLIGVLAIFAVVVGQIVSFVDDLPTIQKKLDVLIKQGEGFIQQQFNMAPEDQTALIKKQVTSAGKSVSTYFGSIMKGVTSVLGGLVITMVYTFLLLFHREKYETFFIKLFGKEHPEKTREVLEEVTYVGQHYISGRTISMFILWVIHAIGFVAVGLKHGILLGGITALLSIIPYVGSYIGGLFPLLMAMVNGDSTSGGPVLEVGIIIVLAHALSTYIIEPLVIGSKLKLSALAMIFSIIAGSMVWGIAGMILFVPLLAMVRIVCERVERLKPYAYLICDPDEGKPSPIYDWFLKIWHKIFPGKKVHSHVRADKAGRK
jgi:predicted PurR-regulated permease PerM